MGIAAAGGGLGKESITGSAGRFLQSGPGFFAAPANGAMGDAKPPRQTLHRSGFARRLLAQSVIDRHRDKFGRALEPFGPARGEHKQRRRIRPAGNRKNEAG